MWRAVGLFALLSAPAAAVNAGLKHSQRLVKLAFQERLSARLHALYGSNRAYYAATQLRGLSGADQRMTEDVERFSAAVAELYAYTFKPLLDVVVFSRSLSRLMGWKPQMAIYAYYVVAAGLLRAASPPLASLGAEEAALRGSYRAAHARLAACAEEVAFNDPPAGATEMAVLNVHLGRLLQHSRLSALQTLFQNVLDGFLVKYGATLVATAAYVVGAGSAERARALRARGPGGAGPVVPVSAESRARDYVRSMRLLSTTSRAVGELVMVYKRLASLAGHTARIAELEEQVESLAGAAASRRGGGKGEDGSVLERLYLRNVSSSGKLLLEEEVAGKVGGRSPTPGSLEGEAPGAPGASGADEPRAASSSALAAAHPPPAPRRSRSDRPRFERVYLASPDGTTLVRELTFAVNPGRSVLLMGPNGCGKSSLLRVAAGLWPLPAGSIAMPQPGDVFYLSQRAYMVSGTLRDQVLYPEVPEAAWRAASPAERARLAPWRKSAKTDPQVRDARICACLDAVELGYLVSRPGGLAAERPWADVLSGGERQRLAVARLLFHRPRYAVLDECTSAVSADGEQRLYAAVVAAGITALSVGHRPALRRFHSFTLRFEGAHHAGDGWSLEKLRESDAEGLEEALADDVESLRAGVQALGPDARSPGAWFEADDNGDLTLKTV